ncbi:hypothetical protein [Paraburkholderia tropica]|uniref:hypothetical protein n=1 Tax=Paraburkholderia tropica TaxID=92647 RepID=UPI0015921E01|nr:hypothetical protein [Paraburkholderia tropica]
MTVAELIAELKRFPDHHVVLVLHDDGDEVGSIFGSTSESSIVDIRADGPGGVVIDCQTDD